MNTLEKKQLKALLGTVNKRCCKDCKKKISKPIMDYLKVNLMYGDVLDEWENE